MGGGREGRAGGGGRCGGGGVAIPGCDDVDDEGYIGGIGHEGSHACLAFSEPCDQKPQEECCSLLVLAACICRAVDPLTLQRCCTDKIAGPE